MGDIWVYNYSGWRRALRPSPRESSMWRTPKKAWVWDGAAWVLVWVDEVEITVAQEDTEGTIDLADVWSASDYSGDQPSRIIARIPDGVTISSGSVNSPALVVSDSFSWNPDLILRLGNGAAIVGAGGEGGEGGSWYNAEPGFGGWEPDSPAFIGKNGGPALSVRRGVRIDSQGTIGGGGGGGGGGSYDITPRGYYYGGGGGGGAGGGEALGGLRGRIESDFLSDKNEQEGGDGKNGSLFNAGAGGHGTRHNEGGEIDRGGYPGADGGGLGQSGAEPGGWLSQTQANPGDPGAAIDGTRDVTFINRGTILGPEIN